MPHYVLRVHMITLRGTSIEVPLPIEGKMEQCNKVHTQYLESEASFVLKSILCKYILARLVYLEYIYVCTQLATEVPLSKTVLADGLHVFSKITNIPLVACRYS